MILVVIVWDGLGKFNLGSIINRGIISAGNYAEGQNQES